ncbi:unnamed protein product [Bursaphelenchus xylophilus]|uniref:(pine wood nematode) hypothetical protein n=1 Tax=Bursaphelenchus xylophilus TaxID=6326 RepID=A0A1I7SV10_BURXY|nr:unnamed protein product [Bursaphelenchus xylophilus]CAG9100712.1 unnamed protein product [Bursaphelenchus xylophilus]
MKASLFIDDEFSDDTNTDGRHIKVVLNEPQEEHYTERLIPAIELLRQAFIGGKHDELYIGIFAESMPWSRMKNSRQAGRMLQELAKTMKIVTLELYFDRNFVFTPLLKELVPVVTDLKCGVKELALFEGCNLKSFEITDTDRDGYTYPMFQINLEHLICNYQYFLQDFMRRGYPLKSSIKQITCPLFVDDTPAEDDYRLLFEELLICMPNIEQITMNKGRFIEEDRNIEAYITRMVSHFLGIGKYTPVATEINASLAAPPRMKENVLTVLDKALTVAGITTTKNEDQITFVLRRVTVNIRFEWYNNMFEPVLEQAVIAMNQVDPRHFIPLD